MNLFNNIGDALGTLLGYILWFFFDLFNSFVPAVFVFVVIIKAVSFPFELKTRKSMQQNARMSAKMQELRKKYANNRQKLNEEMAKLYEQEGLNPMGGCLPQLLPALVFTGVYGAVFRPLTNLFHVSSETLSAAMAKIAEIPGLAGSFNSVYSQLEVIKVFPQVQGHLTMFTPEQISDILDFNRGFNFFGLDLFAVPMGSSFASLAWIWPVLSAVTMLITTLVSMKMSGNDQPAPGCAKVMPFVIPLLFVYLTLHAPAALGVYYTLFNLVSLVQTVIMAKFFGPKALAAREEAARIARLELIEAEQKKK